ncbi:MAG: molybdopterin dinucleotide binding domain-containing protein, partial [Candidatus Bathyarchaeia archaeon]
WDQPPIKAGYYRLRDPRTGKPRGFGTASGRVELWSSVIEALGYEPTPFYDEPLPESPERTPELLEDYPLILISGARKDPMYHSEFRQFKSVRSLHPYPEVALNTNYAQEQNIATGDMVFVETRYGRIKLKARVSPDVHEKVCVINNGWWLPEEIPTLPVLYRVFEVNPNNLTTMNPDYCDQMSGGRPLRSAYLCRVYKSKAIA